MQEATSHADVNIAIYDAGGGKARVVPGEAVVPKGSTVAWHNVTGDPVEVVFHGRTPRIFDPPTKSVELDHLESSDPLLISEDAGPGPYPYVVHVDKGAGVTAQFAEGGSYPRMIVIG